jgi:ATP-dependent Lon protease
MPGKMIQALKQTQTMNPVIMIDEVDKMGISFQGDPASALLEVLDPEQNKEFQDHYLDVPSDLSNVLFIVTANILDTIPEPLKDRMEVMRLSGYIQEEKIEIAKKYLIPKNRKKMGLVLKDISFKKEAIAEIIEGYAREAGVRSLENNIKKILRKVALQKAKGKEKLKKLEKDSKKRILEKRMIDKQDIKEFIGKPIFTSEVYYEQTPIGVATGMAWTALGGVTIYVETRKAYSEKTEMRLTGQAGDVMKESSQIAWSFLASKIKDYAPDKTFFEKSVVHMHIPEGATKKDGPSAGITMVSALLSLIMEKPVNASLAMTGEITLTGRILSIGGVKEKLIAARRAKIKNLIFPKENLRDYDELPEYLKEGLKVHFVEHYDEVYKIAFGKNDEKLGRTKQKKVYKPATTRKKSRRDKKTK